MKENLRVSQSVLLESRHKYMVDACVVRVILYMCISIHWFLECLCESHHVFLFAYLRVVIDDQ